MKSLFLKKYQHYDKIADIRQAIKYLRAEGESLAFVPTMGALHQGHLELIKHAQKSYSQVIVSIFVNPLQFGPTEDYTRYPRTLKRDLELLQDNEVNLVFSPAAAELYRSASMVTINPGPLAEILEGVSRPGFFAGVLTVVNKFFNIIAPDAAYFGEKDYQQLILIRKMATDLNYNIDIIGIPTKRDDDGLALSSRNRYLSDAERAAALVIPRALAAANALEFAKAQDIYRLVHNIISAEPQVKLDYLELRSANLEPAPDSGIARLLLAAHVNSTRLIDNIPVNLTPS